MNIELPYYEVAVLFLEIVYTFYLSYAYGLMIIHHSYVALALVSPPIV